MSERARTRGEEDATRDLVGNGAGLVRERALASSLQGALERLYQLDRVADVHPFVEAADDARPDEAREALLVRASDDGTLEMALRLPRLPPRQGDERGLDLSSDEAGPDWLDPLCQIIEGVSHFVYLASRAEQGRRATHLELELQAEVDKYVVLAAAMAAPRARLDVRASRALRERLYERVAYEHAAGSELGERYRLANQGAHAFVRHLEVTCVATRRFDAMRSALRAYQRAGQEEKLRLGRAA